MNSARSVWLRSSRSLVCSGLAASLALAACGSDDDGTGSGTGGTSAGRGGSAGVAGTTAAGSGGSSAGQGGTAGAGDGTAGTAGAGSGGAPQGDCGDPNGEGVIVYEDVSASTTWSCPVYTLTRPIFVRGSESERTTLSIDAGVVVRGVSGDLDAAKLPGALIVTRSGRLETRGTATAPVVFTSAAAPGSRAPGDWGGVVLLGRAETNVPANYEDAGNLAGEMYIEGLPRGELAVYGAPLPVGPEDPSHAGAGGAPVVPLLPEGGAAGGDANAGRGGDEAGASGESGRNGGEAGVGGEGGQSAAGGAPSSSGGAPGEGGAGGTVDPGVGPDASWDCGRVEYTRIEFAGFEVAPGVELNGLTIGACGRDTVIHHVQVHRGSDDGVEIFGGTVDLSHVVITGAKDDSLDWDQGFRGRMQFVAIQMHDDALLPADQKGDSAIEADGYADPTLPLGEASSPTLYNVTLIAGATSTRGVRFREGTGARLRNAILAAAPGGATEGLVDLADAITADGIARGELALENAIFAGNWPTSGQVDTAGTLYTEADHFTTGAGSSGNDELDSIDSVLPNAFDETAPGWVPAATSAAGMRGVTPEDATGAPSFFDATATFRGAFAPGGADWTAGWTAYPEN
jgi:hypothetical protein